jgi:hypothetical protein
LAILLVSWSFSKYTTPAKIKRDTDAKLNMPQLFTRLTCLLAHLMKHEIHTLKVPYDMFRILVQQAITHPSHHWQTPPPAQKWALNAVKPFFVHATKTLRTAVQLSLNTLHSPGMHRPTALDGGFYRGCHIWGPSLRDWADWSSDLRITIMNPVALVPIRVVGWGDCGRVFPLVPSAERDLGGKRRRDDLERDVHLPLGVDWGDEEEEALKVERERAERGLGYM